MAKAESINVRVTLEEKNKLGARTVAAGLFTISDYVRQVLFVHDTGADMRAAWFDAVAEMKQEREAMRGEWQAARETIEEGISQMKRETAAGKNEILEAVKQREEISLAADRRQHEKKYIADAWLYPCGLAVSFMAGVIFS